MGYTFLGLVWQTVGKEFRDRNAKSTRLIAEEGFQLTPSFFVLSWFEQKGIVVPPGTATTRVDRASTLATPWPWEKEKATSSPTQDPTQRYMQRL